MKTRTAMEFFAKELKPPRKNARKKQERADAAPAPATG
jgi:hypothetical protein